MKTSASTKNIAAALHAVQSELDAIERNAENPNPQFKRGDRFSRYSTLEAVAFHIQPHLNKNDLSITQGCTEDGQSMATRLMHHPSDEWIEGYYPIRSIDNRPQSIMSATTYARRYGAQAIVFAVSEDDDGEGAEGRGKDKLPGRGVAHQTKPHHSPRAVSPHPDGKCVGDENGICIYCDCVMGDMAGEDAPHDELPADLGKSTRGEAPASQIHICPDHNVTMKFKNGVAKTTGKPYAGWFCPKSSKTVKCPVDWSDE